ncbi:hypothetical protein REPUB_Repub01dG0090200 [Reevesia pubescens]
MHESSLKVRNTRNVNRTGQLTGFKLVPGSNCLPLAGSEAKFLRRAAFLKHNPREEKVYFRMNQSVMISNCIGIVCRYVFGVTHIPRLEDWPVMPVERIGFMLMPHGFFNCSPAVDVPPSATDVKLKDNDIATKPIQDGIIAKL